MNSLAVDTKDKIQRGCTGFDGDNKQRLHAEVRVARKTIRGELNADNYEYALAA